MREEILKCDICDDDLRKRSFNGGAAYINYKTYRIFKRIWNWCAREEVSGEYVICTNCLREVGKKLKKVDT